MKLKKFAAAALTAVMSLAMLTACGGGGGSAAAGTGWTRQEVIVENSNGEVPEAKRITKYQTSDGKWLYETYTGSEVKVEGLCKIDGSEYYTVKTASDPWLAYKNVGGATIEVENTYTEESFEEYKATKYKTITITAPLSDGRKKITTEYYDVINGTLKYIKTGWMSQYGYSYEIGRVEINKARVDRVNVDKLNIDNYNKVSWEEFNGNGK